VSVAAVPLESAFVSVPPAVPLVSSPEPIVPAVSVVDVGVDVVLVVGDDVVLVVVLVEAPESVSVVPPSSPQAARVSDKPKKHAQKRLSSWRSMAPWYPRSLRKNQPERSYRTDR
jgi:hypothetical protein